MYNAKYKTMNQDICVNRILRDLKLKELIDSETASELRMYFEMAFTAGWENGRYIFGECKERAVIQLNIEGKKIAQFDSQLKASKKVNYSDRAISRALKTGNKTRAGHYWKYIN
jgi:hypothetical protein